MSITLMDRVVDTLGAHTGALRGVADNLADIKAAIGGSGERVKPSGFESGGAFLSALYNQFTGHGSDPRLVVTFPVAVPPIPSRRIPSAERRMRSPSL